MTSAYLRCLLRELASPVVYALSLAVGLLINLMQAGRPLASWVPFAVPVLVQVFTRSVMRYRARNTETLLSISAERDEPSFLCDDAGKFLVTTGRPADHLRRRGVESLSDLFGGGRQAEPEILAFAEERGEVLELFSPVLDRWYAVRIRRSEPGWMVWLIDVTDRRELDERERGLDRFRRRILGELDMVVKDGDIDQRTARLILEDGWQGVFIARNRDDGSLAGRVFRREDGECRISGEIRVDPDSQASIRSSHRDQRLVMRQLSDYPGEADWREAHPVHPEVEAFLGRYPGNFATWHEAEYTAIAFDKSGSLTAMDGRVFEGLVSMARTVSLLIDLVRASDMKFLQSMEGLCAAAEFSDEITGRHIKRVNRFAELLARRIGLSEECCRWLGQISEIHDIGKVAVPHIIKLDRRLTVDERRNMEMHAVYGHQILRQMMEAYPVAEPRMELAAKIALHHHQHWDGSGYPPLVDDSGRMNPVESRDRGDYAHLRPPRGDEIPVEALIVSLADKYDALRSSRQYKPEFSHERTLAILTEDDRSGRRAEAVFGPDLWSAFLPIADEFRDIYASMRD